MSTNDNNNDNEPMITGQQTNNNNNETTSPISQLLEQQQKFQYQLQQQQQQFQDQLLQLQQQLDNQQQLSPRANNHATLTAITNSIKKRINKFNNTATDQSMLQARYQCKCSLQQFISLNEFKLAIQ
ncbi:hypothetical protein ACTFIW_005486 [Dictyostelium discoideum]